MTDIWATLKDFKETEEEKAQIEPLWISPMQGRKHTPETIEKMRETHRGKVISQEQRDYLSKLYKGKPKSAEMKKNLSEATKLWWKKRKEAKANGG